MRRLFFQQRVKGRVTFAALADLFRHDTRFGQGQIIVSHDASLPAFSAVADYFISLKRVALPVRTNMTAVFSRANAQRKKTSKLRRGSDIIAHRRGFVKSFFVQS